MPPDTLYAEKLLPSPIWWAACCGTGTMAGLVIWPVNQTIALIVAAVAAIGMGVGLWHSSPVIVVTHTELIAGSARIPLSFLGRIDSISRKELPIALGRELDARAYLCLRSWVHSAVRCQILDSQDPTPYWIVSTRKPELLRSAVERAMHLQRTRP